MSMRWIHTVRRALGAAVAAAALAASAGAAPVTIAVTPSALALPIDIAHAQGFFAAEGVEVRLVDCLSGPRCLQKAFERSADIACASEMPVVVSSFDRNDFAVLATVSSAGNNIRLVGRRSAGVKAVGDIAGKRVGVIVGSSSQYFLDAYLLYAGVDPKSIRLVPLQPEQMVSALEQRQVDVIAGYVRHVLPATERIGDDAAVFGHAGFYTETYNLVSRRETLASRRDDLVRVLRALRRAEQFIAEHPEQAKSLMQQRTQFKKADVERLYADYRYQLSLNHSLVSTMEAQARWAIREGHIKAQAVPNYLGYVESGPLRDVMPQLFAK